MRPSDGLDSGFADRSDCSAAIDVDHESGTRRGDERTRKEVAREVESSRLRCHERLLAVLGYKCVQNLFSSLSAVAQRKYFAMKLGGVGAGKICGAAREDVQSASATARQTLFDCLYLSIIARVSGLAGPAHH